MISTSSLDKVRLFAKELLTPLKYSIKYTPNGLEAVKLDRNKNIVKEFVIYTDLKSTNSKIYLYFIYYDNTYEYELSSTRVVLDNTELNEIKVAVHLLDSLN